MINKFLQALGVATVALTLTLGGCCSSGKIEQCNKLIKVINDNGESIKSATAKMNASKNDTKAIEEVATTMEKAADDIKVVELEDEALKGFATEYDQMLRNGANAAREMVKAADANDLTALTKAMEEISKVEAIEATLITKVNGYCTGS